MKQPESNPLRKELARSQQAESHPDSGMLTAFAEGSLLAKERESLLEHLARCAQCREVLSIAVDASPELPQSLPLPQPARRPLRNWLPWVATAAGVLMLSSALLLHQQKKPAGESASVATKEIAQAPAQISQLSPPPEPKIATSPHKALSSAVRREPTPRPEESPEAASPNPAMVTPAPSQGLQTIQAQAETANSNRPREFGSIASGLKKAEPAGEGSEAFSEALKQNASNSRRMAKAEAGRATSQAVGVYGAAPAGAASADTASAPMMYKAAAVDSVGRHWRINQFGQLEHSVGNGSWQPALTHETSKLRVIAVSGSEVWAGGENLRLEHSGDNGKTWESIKLPAKDGYNHALTHITFQTPQEGKIDSDDGTSWQTIDGGKTWK